MEAFPQGECEAPFTAEGPSPRLCDYTGKYFCHDCHWANTAVVPARVVHNWDFDPRPVSQAALQYLDLMERRPVIDILRLNPGLAVVVQELSSVASQRQVSID